jgi:hypothetical protein
MLVTRISVWCQISAPTRVSQAANERIPRTEDSPVERGGFEPSVPPEISCLEQNLELPSFSVRSEYVRRKSRSLSCGLAGESHSNQGPLRSELTTNYAPQRKVTGPNRA